MNKIITQFEKSVEDLKTEYGKKIDQELLVLFNQIQARIPKLKRFGVTNGGDLVFECACETFIVNRVGNKVCICTMLSELFEAFWECEDEPKYSAIEKALDEFIDLENGEYNPLISHIKKDIGSFILCFHWYREMQAIATYADDFDIPVEGNWEKVK